MSNIPFPAGKKVIIVNCDDGSIFLVVNCLIVDYFDPFKEDEREVSVFDHGAQLAAGFNFPFYELETDITTARMLVETRSSLGYMNFTKVGSLQFKQLNLQGHYIDSNLVNTGSSAASGLHQCLFSEIENNGYFSLSQNLADVKVKVGQSNFACLINFYEHPIHPDTVVWTKPAHHLSQVQFQKILVALKERIWKDQERRLTQLENSFVHFLENSKIEDVKKWVASLLVEKPEVKPFDRECMLSIPMASKSRAHLSQVDLTEWSFFEVGVGDLFISILSATRTLNLKLDDNHSYDLDRDLVCCFNGLEVVYFSKTLELDVDQLNSLNHKFKLQTSPSVSHLATLSDDVQRPKESTLNEAFMHFKKGASLALVMDWFKKLNSRIDITDARENRQVYIDPKYPNRVISNSVEITIQAHISAPGSPSIEQGIAKQICALFDKSLFTSLADYLNDIYQIELIQPNDIESGFALAVASNKQSNSSTQT